LFYFFLGRWDDAVAELDVVLDQLDEQHVRSFLRLLAHSVRALIAGHRDDGSVLQTQLAAASELGLATTELRSNSEYVLRAQALAEERAGRPDQAVGILAHVLQPDFARDMADRQTCLPTLVRLALAVGDGDLARAAVEAGAGDAERGPVADKAAAAGHCRGLVAGDAIGLRAAAEDFRAIGNLPDQADTLEDLAVVCAEHGDAQAARAAFTEAVEIYVGLGAVWDIRRAQDRLRPYGIGGRSGIRTRPTSGWFALTPTEVRVARRVADGLSNPDIAAELFLSRRTVQTHVSHILSKLEVRSRWEIARVAAGHPTAEADAEAV
jgi:DNA-binding CsgD family transcriptional regulator